MPGKNSWHHRSRSDIPRLVCFDALQAVHRDGAYANIVLPRLIARAHLDKRDASFATNLTYGVLRMQGRWDAIISRCSVGRDLGSIDVEALDLLRMGCHQLLEMRTPPHAAINETVTIARNEISQSVGGFVNAVLRRVAERGQEWEEIIAASTSHRHQYLASWYSHPRWVVEKLEDALVAHGREAEEIIALLQADNTPAHVALVPRDITRGQLEENLRRAHMEFSSGVLMPDAVTIQSGDPGRLWAVRRGEAGVQDEGSQLIAHLLAHAKIDGKDDLWLDMCAGPGGKTATLASLASQRNARIHANEPHEHRLDLVAENVRAFDDIVDLRLGDGRDLGQEEADSYDRVLVDAPCTGLGALRRRPEARWNKSEEDLTELVKLQGELLESAWKATRPGGVIVYSTCSPVREETLGVMNSFIQAHPEAVTLDLRSLANRLTLRDVGGEGAYLQLWPDLHQSDAMFIAGFRKPAA